MRKSLLYILLVVLLTACDFFYSEVPYKGHVEDQVLLVNSTMYANDRSSMVVYVGHSYFFMDSTQYEWKTADDRNNYFSFQVRRRGVVTDAQVSLQVGQDAPIPMTFSYVPSSEDANFPDTLGYYTNTENPYHIKPGDTVRLKVSHTQYGTAEAVQVCPAEIVGHVENPRLSKYGELAFELSLPAYTGGDDDVLAVVLDATKLRANVYDELDLEHSTPLYDYTYVPIPYLYSLDPVFSGLSNKQTQSGYWGGNVLYIPTSALQKPQRVACVMDMHLPSNPQEVVVVDTLYMRLSLVTMTSEGYQYNVSYQRAVLGESSLPELTSKETGNVDILGGIQEIFDALGGLEEYQLYGNMEGKPQRPFGHFSLQQMSYASYDYEREE